MHGALPGASAPGHRADHAARAGRRGGGRRLPASSSRLARIGRPRPSRPSADALRQPSTSSLDRPADEPGCHAGPGAGLRGCRRPRPEAARDQRPLPGPGGHRLRGRRAALDRRPAGSVAHGRRHAGRRSRDWLLLVAVKDRLLADAALGRHGSRPRPGRGTPATYQGTRRSAVAEGAAGRCSSDLLIVAPDVPTLRPRSWMRSRTPPVAGRRSPASSPPCVGCRPTTWRPPTSTWRRRRAAGSGDQLGGYSHLGAALIAEPDGLHLRASRARSTRDAASDRGARGVRARPASRPASADWMPPDTQAAAVFFGLRHPGRGRAGPGRTSPAQQITIGAEPAARAGRLRAGHQPGPRPAAAVRWRDRPGGRRPDRGSAPRASSSLRPVGSGRRPRLRWTACATRLQRMADRVTDRRAGATTVDQHRHPAGRHAGVGQWPRA